MVTGILLLDKPAGISSNHALQQAKRLFNADKAGHTGSLDPLATGLLPICFGEATKIAGYLLGSRKTYAAQCRLGTTTTTDDAEGEVVRTRPIPEITDTTIEAAMATLRGRIVQTPPAYSAIKQGGIPLYKRARRGEDVVVPSREVEVDRFDLQGRAGDTLSLHVECGSGTYVRSLARDLGERLGCGAHLTALRRVWVEPFRDPVMHTLESLERVAVDGGLAALDHLLLPIEAGLGALPALHLDAEQARRLRHGQRLSLPGQGPLPLCRAMDVQGRLVALVRLDADSTAAIVRGFAAPD
ncbi:MAG: tRNA pseudouridine(55) synthase TruB [Rudaea sp.]